jgi:hypothetical protein
MRNAERKGSAAISLAGIAASLTAMKTNHQEFAKIKNRFF